MVSVVMKNMGGEFFQPMLKVKCIATMDSSSSYVSKTRARLAISAKFYRDITNSYSNHQYLGAVEVRFKSRKVTHQELMMAGK